jgi:hypothetical protein
MGLDPSPSTAAPGEGISHTGQGNPAQAVANLRTSSASNVGADKDSEKRGRQAIETYKLRDQQKLEDTPAPMQYPAWTA